MDGTHDTPHLEEPAVSGVSEGGTTGDPGKSVPDVELAGARCPCHLPVHALLTVLGIETRCDETAGRRSSADGAPRRSAPISCSRSSAEHAPYGGVVPESRGAGASRPCRRAGARGRSTRRVIEPPGDSTAVAGASGAGADWRAAWSGRWRAKGMAWAAREAVYVAVNHLEAHALTARLSDGVAFPYLLLLVSGGHSQLLACTGVGEYRQLGTTLDDAAGEAFDKSRQAAGSRRSPAARRSRRAARRRRSPAASACRGRSPGRGGLRFLVLGAEDGGARAGRGRRAGAPPATVADLAAADRAARSAEALADRTAARGPPGSAPALPATARDAGRRRRSCGEWKAAAAARRARRRIGARLVAPPPALCTDNGAMIAWAGLERLRLGLVDGLDAPVRPRWPLDPAAIRAKGARR